MLDQHEIEIRVRYQETDGQGRVHHANFLTYFELGRTELLRAGGQSYRRLEEQGLYLVVARMQCRYHLAARYDDLLRLRTRTAEVTRASIRNIYEVRRGDDLIAEGETTLACVDRTGRIRRIPDWFR